MSIEGTYPEEDAASGYCLDTYESTIISHTEKQENLDLYSDLEKGPMNTNNYRNTSPSIKHHSQFYNEEKFEVYHNNTKSEVLRHLRARCWNIMDKAIKLGPYYLLQRHAKLFSDRMDRAKVEFNGVDTNNPALALDEVIPERLENKHKKGITPIITLQPESGENVRSAMGMYEFGRYLMFSTATRSAANLQVRYLLQQHLQLPSIHP